MLAGCIDLPRHPLAQPLAATRACLLLCSCCLQVEGVQPTTTPDDNVLAEHIIMSDARIRALLRERYNITDPDLIVFDPWTLHGTPEGYEGRRLMQVGAGGSSGGGLSGHSTM